MPGIKFSQEDLLGGKELSAAWYKFRVKGHSEGPGKTDPTATVWKFDFVVEDGLAKGIPVSTWFSEKQMWRLANFLRCFTGSQVNVGQEYDLNQLTGKLVQGHAYFDPQAKWNVIDDFKPAA